jgi:hypothetical protein
MFITDWIMSFGVFFFNFTQAHSGTQVDGIGGEGKISLFIKSFTKKFSLQYRSGDLAAGAIAS